MTAWDQFLDVCLACKNRKELSELLELFLTLEEKQSLCTRTLIIKELLLKQKSQRQIAKEIPVSIAKITRGSNELKRITSRLRAFLEKNL